MPPREPSGRSSLCRSSWSTCRESRIVRGGNHRRQTDGESRDLACHGEIPLEVRRRNRQDVGKVVEAAVRCFISGQLRRDVDVERERSRIAFVYSARLSRCTAPMRPGFGCASHALSIARSSDEAAAS